MKSASEYNEKGNAKVNLGNYEEALRINPEYPEAYNNRGVAKANLGNYEEALKDYEEALRLNPEIINPYYSTKNIKDRLENYNKTIKEHYDKIFNNRGLAKAKLEYYDKAIKDYEEVLRINDKSWMFYFYLGKAYSHSENLEKSINLLIEAIKLNKKSKESLLALGEVLLKYLNSELGKEKTLSYLKEREKSIKNNDQPIEKFVEYKCYFLINNLKKMDSLHEKIKKHLKVEISKEFRKEFKIKVNRFKIKEIRYKDSYYIYKSINNNLLFSLNEKKLRKGNPYLFNDPFDPYYKEYSNEESPIIIEEELKKIRISCFGENNNNLLMWAHYGDEHKGICIEYKNLKDKIDDFTCLEKVVYEEIKTHKETRKNSDLLIDEIKIDEELLTINEMCLRKHKDWQYENEWRMISLEEENKNELYYDNMEISKIFFGMKCEVSNIKLITKLLKDRTEIIFYKMTQGDNLNLDSREIELDENRDVILDGKGKIKLKPKNKESN